MPRRIQRIDRTNGARPETKLMSAEIAAEGQSEAQPAKAAPFAGGLQGNVRQNRRRRFCPMNQGA
jgi:hypothetical protein